MPVPPPLMRAGTVGQVGSAINSRRLRQLRNAVHQAFRQKSASKETELQRVTGEMKQELQEFDDKLAGRRRDLTAARREVRLRRSQLGQPKKRVSFLEETIGQFCAASADEDSRIDAPEDRADEHRPEDGDSYEAVRGHGDENVIPAEVQPRPRPAQTTQVRRRARRDWERGSERACGGSGGGGPGDTYALDQQGLATAMQSRPIPEASGPSATDLCRASQPEPNRWSSSW